MLWGHHNNQYTNWVQHHCYRYLFLYNSAIQTILYFSFLILALCYMLGCQNDELLIITIMIPIFKFVIIWQNNFKLFYVLVIMLRQLFWD